MSEFNGRLLKREAVRIAELMLARKLPPLEGVHSLARLGRKLEAYSPDSASIGFFDAVTSEAEDLPFGKERLNWSPLALERKDAETAQYLERIGDAIDAECNALILALGELDEPS